MVNLSPQFFKQSMEVQEIAITLVVKGLNPAMLTLENCHAWGVIPEDWELSKNPMISSQQARLNFKNGVNVMAKPHQINFAEPIPVKGVEGMKFAAVAKQFVDQLTQVNYQQLRIEPRLIIVFNHQENDLRNYPREFILDYLMASGPWLNVGERSPQIAVNFTYQFPEYQLQLNIQEGYSQQSNQSSVRGLVFSGSFIYPINEKKSRESIKGEIDTWSNQLNQFQTIVKEQFLGKKG
ncbi:hypothetical protein FRE64_01080 [Euhalothece natronophila Z-M001]|uniref:TIGR04255 family protein n=1 Tax=Euhalothece natronophila Z-M001 TaxID=522448 RepID=A0A5B8NIB3_9CHRO|nr:hypothetical protein [Euhalothece natronophila]QDZ38657.1 hypothetical protein FRE64_01080 [Euhalothece natronophila Z-M001]